MGRGRLEPWTGTGTGAETKVGTGAVALVLLGSRTFQLSCWSVTCAPSAIGVVVKGGTRVRISRREYVLEKS